MLSSAKCATEHCLTCLDVSQTTDCRTAPKGFCRAYHNFGCFLINITTVAFRMLHEIVTVAGSHFVGSQALAAECHKPEVIGQHTWLERIADSTIQLPRSRFIYMAKTDIKKALRNVPLCPEDFCLFCLGLNGQFHRDHNSVNSLHIIVFFSKGVGMGRHS